MKYVGRFSRLSFVTAVILTMLLGCGGSTEQVPVGSTVSITPDEAEWVINADSDTPCQPIEQRYQDELVIISVQDSQSRPIGDTEIVVSLALAENTSVYNVVELYEDKDGDLIPDKDELVSEENDALLVTKTDEYTGEKYLIVRMNVSCLYRSVMRVTAQSAVGQASFIVKKSDI